MGVCDCHTPTETRFVEDLVYVVLDRAKRQPESPGDLLVGATGRDQSGNLAFARRETGQAGGGRGAEHDHGLAKLAGCAEVDRESGAQVEVARQLDDFAQGGALGIRRVERAHDGAQLGELGRVDHGH